MGGNIFFGDGFVVQHGSQTLATVGRSFSEEANGFAASTKLVRYSHSKWSITCNCTSLSSVGTKIVFFRSLDSTLSTVSAKRFCSNKDDEENAIEGEEGEEGRESYRTWGLV